MGFFFDHESFYLTPGLLATDRIHLSKAVKDLCSGVSKAHWKGFKLDLKGESDKTRLDRDLAWRQYDNVCGTVYYQGPSVCHPSRGRGWSPCNTSLMQQGVRDIDGLEKTGAHENCHIGIKASTPKR